MPEIRDDRKWAARLRQIAERVGSQPYVKVGFPEGATYPDGTSLPMVAAVQEFGATINRAAGTTTIYRSLNLRTGEFNRGGRFVPRSRANFATEHAVGAHTINIPARPFMRNTIAEHSKGWPRAAARALAVTDMDALRALKTVGEGIQSQIVQSIQNLYEPALADSTIRSKRFALDPTKPLIDTGFMWQHVAIETGNESVT